LGRAVRWGGLQPRKVTEPTLGTVRYSAGDAYANAGGLVFQLLM
jgi:hypothetical protein